MGFLSEILKRSKNEKPYLPVPVGYPANGVRIPNITKKTLQEILNVIDLPQRQVTTKDLPAIPWPCATAIEQPALISGGQ